ncbi:hypothetical protein FS749_004395 [Ceratobasidium sp. UAMH 11750]|nr:hypothetical protein FS749_004395 [Ceratobasidium sp. UAMH 11750]
MSNEPEHRTTDVTVGVVEVLSPGGEMPRCLEGQEERCEKARLDILGAAALFCRANSVATRGGMEVAGKPVGESGGVDLHAGRAEESLKAAIELGLALLTQLRRESTGSADDPKSPRIATIDGSGGTLRDDAGASPYDMRSARSGEPKITGHNGEPVVDPGIHTSIEVKPKRGGGAIDPKVENQAVRLAVEMEELELWLDSTLRMASEIQGWMSEAHIVVHEAKEKIIEGLRG